MLSDRSLKRKDKKDMSRVYEIVVMQEQKVGIDSKEIVENIYTCQNEITAERFLAFLRTNGFQPRLRCFVCQPYVNGTCNFNELLADLQKRSVEWDQ